MKYILFPLILFIILICSSCAEKRVDSSSSVHVDTSMMSSKNWVPNFDGKKKMSENDKAFIEQMGPKILYENKQILKTREYILKLEHELEKHRRLSQHDIAFLQQTAKHYNMPFAQFHPKASQAVLQKQFDELLKRVDIVPARLCMAQAIIESEWGRSRFAKEAKNYFGVHCYTKGCGLSAKGVENPKFWVKSYPNAQSSIKDYMHFLNTMPSMKDFREIRAKQRSAGYIDPERSAQGLEVYSGIGDQYIKQIHSVLRDFVPDNLSVQ